MLKYILVLLSIFTGAQALAGEGLSQECLQQLSANAPQLRKSAIAVIKGEDFSHYKKSKQIPVDVQVFNDAHDLLAALPHLSEPQVLEERQILVLGAICANPNLDQKSLGLLIESLPVPL